MSETDAKEIILKGVSGSPGICIGKAYLVDSEGIDVVDRYYIKKNQIQSEENRFKAAVMKARKELNAIIEDRSEDTRRNTDILETHMILLKDKLLYGKTLETVKKERINAEWAFKKVVANVKSMFKNMKKGKVAKATQEKLNSIIDKASKRKIIHKNKAARLKSRVSRFLKLKKKS